MVEITAHRIFQSFEVLGYFMFVVYCYVQSTTTS